MTTLERSLPTTNPRSKFPKLLRQEMRVVDVPISTRIGNSILALVLSFIRVDLWGMVPGMDLDIPNISILADLNRFILAHTALRRD